MPSAVAIRRLTTGLKHAENHATSISPIPKLSTMFATLHYEPNYDNRLLHPSSIPDVEDSATSPATPIELGGDWDPPPRTSTSKKLVQESAFVAPVALIVIFIICLALMRLYFCCERILSSNGTEHQQMSNDENGQPKKMRWTKRPQEAIEKMLILKKVIVLDATTTKQQIDTISSTTHQGLSRSDSRQESRIPEQRKCDLVIQRGASDEDEADSSLTCSICLCSFEHGDAICYSRNQQCSHRFHAVCAFAWFAQRDECPVCRADYLLESVQVEEGAAITLISLKQRQEEIPTPGSVLSRSAHNSERDIESPSPFLNVLLGRNVNGRRQPTASWSLEGNDEATEDVSENGDRSSRGVAQAGMTLEDVPDISLQSYNRHSEACSVSCAALRAFNDTTDTEQIMRCPSLGPAIV